MTMVDIRELEEQTKRELDEERAKVNFFCLVHNSARSHLTESARSHLQTRLRCCGSAMVSVRIRIQIQGFDEQKMEKIYS
jgi:hypothetical protein